MATSGGKPSHQPLSTAALSESDSTDPQATLPVDQSDRTQIISARDVTPAPTPAPGFKLVVLAGPKAGSEFLLEADDFTVGRATDNLVSIPDVSVSRKHARFLRKDGGFEVTDLNSGNGTKLNGKTVPPNSPVQANHGDELALGDSVLQVIDLGAPLPDRMKPIHTLQSPSGQQGAPNTTTQVENLRVAAPVAEIPAPKAPEPTPAPATQTKASVSPVSPPPAKPSAPAKSPAGGANKRVKLYVAVGALMVVFFALAAVMKNQPPPPGPDPIPPAPTGEKWPEEVLKARDAVVKRRDWAAAVAELEPLKKEGTDSEIAKQWLEAAPIEAAYQRKLKDATAALNANDFASAVKDAKTIPEVADVYPLAQALLDDVKGRVAGVLSQARQNRSLELVEQVLRFQPDNADALALKAELTRPVQVAQATPTPTNDNKPKPTSTPTPVVAKDPFAGPWRDAYLDNRLSDAMREAETSPNPDIKVKYLDWLRAFQQNYQAGMRAAEGKRIPEAARALEAAFRFDKQLAGNLQPNKPGREVRKQLANMQYILSLDARGDDQLAYKAKFLRSAVEADPSHELANKALKETYGRAREIYTEGYVDRTSNPEKAKRQLKNVIQVMPPGDETREKAQYWLDKMEGRIP